MQRFIIYLFLWDALHVSDDFSVRHQELKTAHTASDISKTNMAGRDRLAAGTGIGLTNA